MNQWQKINLTLFLLFTFITCGIVYVAERMDMSSPYEKPWHLLPSVHEDTLSQTYKNDYAIYDKRRMILQNKDSLQKVVLILVDAWGVPIQENQLKEDFEIFEKIPHIYGLHQRLANRTKHAEMTEYRGTLQPNIFLFGGDSTEYNRKHYIEELGIEQSLFCQFCSDSTMLFKTDSSLLTDSLKTIMWSTQTSRTGDRDSLHKTIKGIATLAKSHPDVLFIVQGTHRPILGTPETRMAHKSHWVPVVLLNRQ